MLKAVLVGRHRLLKKQVDDLRRLGIDEVVNVLSLPEDRSLLEELVDRWVSEGVRYVVVQALPLRVLKELWDVCRSRGVSVLIARMESVGLTESEDEARRIVGESPDSRTYIKGVQDRAYRVIEFKYWEKIKELKVILEPVK